MIMKTLAALAALVAMAGGNRPQHSETSAATQHASISVKKPGRECIKTRFGRECETGITVENSELAISPDGKNGYLTTVFYDNSGEDGIWSFDRNPATGLLVQKRGTAGCVAQARLKGCARGRGLYSPSQIAVSPDGLNVYASTVNAIAIFNRDPSTGDLTQPAGAAGCITSDLKENPTCAPGRSLGGAIALSPDGLSVYNSGGNGGSVAVLDRDPTTGALTQKPGSVRVKAGAGDLLVSPDGKNVYVGTYKPEGIEAFNRDPATGALARVPGRAGCIVEKGKGGCRRGHELISFGLSISPDGRNVYGAASHGPGQPDWGSLMVLDRLPDGSLTQEPGRAGCFVLYEGEGCARADSLGEANNTAVSADGKRVYVFNYYDNGAAIFFRHPSGRLTEGPAD